MAAEVNPHRLGYRLGTLVSPSPQATWSPARVPASLADTDEFPTSPSRDIGYFSGAIYSYSLRKFPCLGCLDLEASNIGNEVIVQWGDHGVPIKNIRATVARYPYVTDGRNSLPMILRQF